MSALREAFAALLTGRSLSAEQALAALREVFDGAAPDALVAGLLVAMRLKGESAAELAGAARAMLERARPAGLEGFDLLDTAGTGGDGAQTFNVSTGAALVAASAGVRVAKHGNRAASGRVGAADLMESLGVRIDLDPAGLRRCLEAAGICFVFAPAYHPAMARFAGLRRELGVRTLFNLLGPLSNPARPRRQLLGVAEPALVRPMAEAIAALGVRHAMVVHGEDGIDEISAAAPTRVAEVREGRIEESRIDPRDLGVRGFSPAAVRVEGAEQATAMLRGALAGQAGPAQDLLALNSGAAIYLGGRARSMEEGVTSAREILATGKALAIVERLRRASRKVAP